MARVRMSLARDGNRATADEWRLLIILVNPSKIPRVTMIRGREGSARPHHPLPREPKPAKTTRKLLWSGRRLFFKRPMVVRSDRWTATFHSGHVTQVTGVVCDLPIPSAAQVTTT
jgi:hypothetical protein